MIAQCPSSLGYTRSTCDGKETIARSTSFRPDSFRRVVFFGCPLGPREPHDPGHSVQYGLAAGLDCAHLAVLMGRVPFGDKAR